MKGAIKTILTLLAVFLAACSSRDDETQTIVPGDPQGAGDDDIGAVVKLSESSVVWLDSTNVSHGKKTKTFTYSYRSKNASGDTIRLTALIGWPQANVRPKNLLIGCHITITNDVKAPTNFNIEDAASDVGMLLMHATEGNGLSDNALVIMPDYEGYGGTITHTHPYLCQQLTARQVVDAVRAGLKLFKEQKGEMADGWKGFSVGYSQGGAVAMATHRLIEQEKLTDELHFCGSVCGAGPYDLVATFRQYISDNKVYQPVVVPLILKGFCEYNQSLKGYQPADFLTQTFLDTGVLDMIGQKTLSTGEIEEKMEDYAKAHPEVLKFRYDDNGEYLRPEMILRPECIAWLKGETVAETDKVKLTALMQALEENTVWGPWEGYGDWQPQHPIEAYHSVNDEVVPYVNFVQAMDHCGAYFKGNAYDSSFLSLHVGAGYMFFGFYCTSLIEEIIH